MWRNVIIALLILHAVAAAPFPVEVEENCPQDCHCTPTSDRLIEAKCATLTFIHPNKLRKLSHLDLSHAQLSKVPKMLQKFPVLTHLNLSDNHLQQFQVDELPRHLKNLDLSGNLLTDIPDGLDKLRLEVLNLQRNALRCACVLENKVVKIAASGTVVVRPMTCPPHFNCVNEDNDLDKMQGDQPLESSMEGSGNGEEESEAEEISSASPSPATGRKLEDIQKEELLPTQTHSAEDVYEDDEEVEGSGDEDEQEGSGMLVIPTDETKLKACNFDCSTPLSIEDDKINGTNATEPDPNLLDEIGKVFGIFGDDEDQDQSNETEIVETPMINVKAKESESDRDSILPITLGESEKIEEEPISDANSETKEANTFGLTNNMMIVIGLIIVMVCIVIYSILVKKRKSKRQRTDSNDRDREMVEMKKPLNTQQTQTPIQSVPEKVPLMNGQNGRNGMNGHKDPAPPETTIDNEHDEPEADEEDMSPYLRKKNDPELLPQTHRVTVQAKELSAPKTPMLVNRTRSHDGKIITTPEPTQRL